MGEAEILHLELFYAKLRDCDSDESLVEPWKDDRCSACLIKLFQIILSWVIVCPHPMQKDSQVKCSLFNLEIKYKSLSVNVTQITEKIKDSIKAPIQIVWCDLSLSHCHFASVILNECFLYSKDFGRKLKHQRAVKLQKCLVKVWFFFPDCPSACCWVDDV